MKQAVGDVGVAGAAPSRYRQPSAESPDLVYMDHPPTYCRLIGPKKSLHILSNRYILPIVTGSAGEGARRLQFSAEVSVSVLLKDAE